MKIDKIKVGLTELRKTEDFENRRFSLELEAVAEHGDTFQTAYAELVKTLKEKVSEFFDEGLDDKQTLYRKLKKYRDEFGPI